MPSFKVVDGGVTAQSGINITLYNAADKIDSWEKLPAEEYLKKIDLLTAQLRTLRNDYAHAVKQGQLTTPKITRLSEPYWNGKRYIHQEQQ